MIIVANWKGKKPDYRPEEVIAPPNVRIILCPGHNGEIGCELPYGAPAMK